MLTLHHLEYSQSFRILWLLEALGEPYELKSYNRDPESNLAPDDYKALSSLGTAPVVTDGDLVLAQLAQGALHLPKQPMIFTKFPSCLVGPRADIGEDLIYRADGAASVSGGASVEGRFEQLLQ